MADSLHSRYPVYSGSLDNIIGFITVKDIFSAMVVKENIVLQDYLRDVLLVVPSMPVMDLLLKMRMERNHMAMVVDEFGGIDGIVTIEDVIEEIVGEIEDEHDTMELEMSYMDSNGGATVDARYNLVEFCEKLGDILSPKEKMEDIETIGGLVIYTLGRVPSRGEVVIHTHSGLEFEIIDADPRKINLIYIRNIEKYYNYLAR